MFQQQPQKTSRAERRKVSCVRFGILKPDEIVSSPPSFMQELLDIPTTPSATAS